MFSNEYKYQSEYGEIKHSYAYGNFHFKGKTKGIALKYVQEGYENYWVNEQNIQVSKGQFILVPNGQSYEVSAQSKSQQVHGLCIDLNPIKLGMDLDKIYSNALLCNLPFECSNFSSLSKELDHIRSNRNYLGNVEQKAILKTLHKRLDQFANELTELADRLSIQTEKITTQRSILVKLFYAKNFVYQCFNQKIKLEQLAQYTGISKYHFLRLFKLCFEQSPLELQEQLRMQYALESMQNPKLNFSHLAYNLGYPDLASFSKKFKKKYGLSPSKYRKMRLSNI